MPRYSSAMVLPHHHAWDSRDLFHSSGSHSGFHRPTVLVSSGHLLKMLSLGPTAGLVGAQHSAFYQVVKSSRRFGCMHRFGNYFNGFPNIKYYKLLSLIFLQTMSPGSNKPRQKDF